MVIVPIYETLGTEACSYIIGQTETSTVVCNGNQQASLLIKLAANTKVLKRIAIIENASNEVVALGQQENIEVLQFQR